MKQHKTMDFYRQDSVEIKSEIEIHPQKYLENWQDKDGIIKSSYLLQDIKIETNEIEDLTSDKEETKSVSSFTQECHKKLDSKDKPTVQKQIHLEERPFQCDQCPKKFRTRAHRLSHLQIHKQKIFQCDKCPKKYISNSLLIFHKQVHSGNLKFQCDKSFIRESHLLNHTRLVHEGITFDCDVCGKAFSSIITMNDHKHSVHTGETPCQYDVCPESFASRGNLNSNFIGIKRFSVMNVTRHLKKNLVLLPTNELIPMINQLSVVNVHSHLKINMYSMYIKIRYTAK